MPSQQNIDQLQQINDKLAQAKCIVFADYSGLNVSEQNELRAKIVEAGGEFTISKNTLLKLALKNKSKDLPQETYDALNGPTSIVYGYEDAVSATKVLVQFSKEHEALELKVGILTGVDDQPNQFLDIDAITNLATLPSRDELRARVVAQLNSPISGFVNVLSGNLRGLVQVLGAIKDQKSN